jgi:hypothetical protein
LIFLPFSLLQFCHRFFSQLYGEDLKALILRPAPPKNSQHPLLTIGSVWWVIPLFPATKGSTDKRTAVQAGQDIKQDPLSKITNAKMSGDVA